MNMEYFNRKYNFNVIIVLKTNLNKNIMNMQNNPYCKNNLNYSLTHPRGKKNYLLFATAK